MLLQPLLQPLRLPVCLALPGALFFFPFFLRVSRTRTGMSDSSAFWPRQATQESLRTPVPASPHSKRLFLNAAPWWLPLLAACETTLPHKKQKNEGRAGSRQRPGRHCSNLSCPLLRRRNLPSPRYRPQLRSQSTGRPAPTLPRAKRLLSLMPRPSNPRFLNPSQVHL